MTSHHERAKSGSCLSVSFSGVFTPRATFLTRCFKLCIVYQHHFQCFPDKRATAHLTYEILTHLNTSFCARSWIGSLRVDTCCKLGSMSFFKSALHFQAKPENPILHQRSFDLSKCRSADGGGDRGFASLQSQLCGFEKA